MDELELLRSIHPIWVQRITLSLAKGAGLRADLKTQLERFFELLSEVVDTGDPAWLDSVISDWSASLTETDLASGQNSITPFIREIMLLTYQVIRETLDAENALDLISALLPAFAYAFEKSASLETQVRISYISNQLKEVQATLERLDQSKSDFIAVAAHELRTPLTLIEGYTAMVRDSRESKSITPFETDLLNGIDNGTRRLKTIIDDMIDVSMIDNNLLQLNFQPVWVNRLLDVLKNEVESATKERRQELLISKFPGSDEMTFGDPERLLQVLRNILTNAIKFTPDGGTIRVDGRKLPGFEEIIISDTGIGINQEDQNIIFEKFTRLGNISLHSSGKTKFKGGGPGLGLHIARGIIQAHGGAIWMESPGFDEGSNPGSTFHIILPMHSSPPDNRMTQLFSNVQSDKPSEVSAE